MEELLAIYDPSASMRFGVHTNLFTSSVLYQSSPEQLQKFEPLVRYPIFIFISFIFPEITRFWVVLQ